MTNDWVQKQAKVCGSLGELRERYSSPSEDDAVDASALVAALNEFQECVRYLNTRRSSGAVLNLNSEADVQDAVYLMLRPWVRDIVSESPTERHGNRYTIKDFITIQANTIIEIKYVRDAAHGRQISKEMHDDIETYRHHPSCRTIIFFVYDPDSLIPDQDTLRRQIEEPRTYGVRSLKCILIVKP